MPILIMILFIAQNSFGANWLIDSHKSICKSVKYDAKCEIECDGHTDFNVGNSFIESTGRPFGSWYRSNCGKGNTCGDAFSLESRKNKKVKCEEFVEALQKKNRECKNCLEESNSGDR